LLQAGCRIRDISTDNHRRLLEVFSLRLNCRGSTPELVIKFHKHIRAVLRGVFNDVTRLDALRYDSETDVAVALNPIIDIGAPITENDQKHLGTRLRLVSGGHEYRINSLGVINVAANNGRVDILDSSAMSTIELYEVFLEVIHLLISYRRSTIFTWL